MMPDQEEDRSAGDDAAETSTDQPDQPDQGEGESSDEARTPRAGEASTQTSGGGESPRSEADSDAGGDTGASASFQVTFDANDPRRLADFWASVLGYKSQPPPNGFDSWPGFLDSIGVPEDKHDSAWALVDPEGIKPRLFFQKVPETKSVKNRVHLDVHASLGAEPDQVDDRRTEAVERLEGLGATRQDEKTEMGLTWVVMTDPEGNEFCVS
jgi:Glyoxalase-like domain